MKTNRIQTVHVANSMGWRWAQVYIIRTQFFFQFLHLYFSFSAVAAAAATASGWNEQKYMIWYVARYRFTALCKRDVAANAEQFIHKFNDESKMRTSKITWEIDQKQYERKKETEQQNHDHDYWFTLVDGCLHLICSWSSRIYVNCSCFVGYRSIWKNADGQRKIFRNRLHVHSIARLIWRNT